MWYGFSDCQVERCLLVQSRVTLMTSTDWKLETRELSMRDFVGRRGNVLIGLSRGIGDI